MATVTEKPRDTSELDPYEAQARMLEAIREIKADRAKYEQLRDELKSKTSDDERAEVLVNFITRHEDLAKGLPSGDDATAIGVTTITVTTIFIFAESAY